MATNKLEQLDTHFGFGENWAEYSDLIDEKAILDATADLKRLFPEGLEGVSFMDIGCGSGLHSLAAARLGAKKIYAVDLDPKSVGTARKMFEKFAPDIDFTSEVRSVFELDPDKSFDVVYSWGVLHHTGDMDKALKCARAAVKPGGRFVIALYGKTALCWAWKIEKWVYVKSNNFIRGLLNSTYIGAFKLACLIKGKNFNDYINKRRGMNFYTDVKDWLGGYPYESISEKEMLALAKTMDMTLEHSYVNKAPIGVAGSVCDEYAFRAIA